MNRKLNNKVTVVAGFATKLSFGIVKVLLEEDATVIVPVQSSQDILSLRTHIKGVKSGRLITLLTDLPDYDKGVETVEAVLEEYGQLDIVVAAFDYQHSNSGLFEIANSEWQKAIEENISSYFICSRISLDVMKRKRQGMFIGISDTNNLNTEPRNAMANIVTALQMEISRQFYDEVKNTGIKFYHLFINDANTGFQVSPEMVGRHIINLYNGEAHGTHVLFQSFPDTKTHSPVHH